MISDGRWIDFLSFMGVFRSIYKRIRRGKGVLFKRYQNKKEPPCAVFGRREAHVRLEVFYLGFFDIVAQSGNGVFDIAYR